MTQEKSPLTFRGRAVWFGTNSEFLAQPDSVVQEEDDVESRKLMIWGLNAENSDQELNQAISEVVGTDSDSKTRTG